MSTTLITVKVDPAVKKKIKKITAELGLTVSGIINAYLKQVIRDEKIAFSLKTEENPSFYLLNNISKLEKERKNGEVYSFDKKEETLDFLEKQML